MTDLFAGRYELGALLGVGGMGRVFAAHDRRLDRRVAIKLVPADVASPEARQRFVREARASARFTHPNAVATFDAGEADGELYLVTELVDGESLATKLARGPLDPAVATSIAEQVLSALAAAHAAGIVHRDVKPGNILLGRDGTAKLADFGIAKRLDDIAADLTMAGELVGTPKYLAPELLDGQPATPASDVYAVGVVLFEMLAGDPPFDAETPFSTALAHREAPVPDVRQRNPAVSASLATVAATAMAKDPAVRFDSAAAMLDALRLAAPAVSPPVPAPEPTQVIPAYSGPYSGPGRWWVAGFAGVAIAAVVLTLVVLGSDDPDGTATESTAPAAAATTVPSTTTQVSTVAPTTIATTTVAPADPGAVAPGDVDGLIAVLEANPDAYGIKAEELARELRTVHGEGRGNQRKAAELLQKAEEWADNGELEPVTLTLLHTVLDPLAAEDDGPGRGNDEDDDGDDD